jgi:hypothetical protein
MTCTTDASILSGSFSSVGTIIGIVIGSVLALGFLICVILIIYFICCKRKPQAQVWAYPCDRPQGYGQMMPMFPYSQGPIQPLQTDPRRTIEGPPPAYEDISIIENPSEKF